MSEELNQRGLEDQGVWIGQYEFFNIGNTTLNQLKAANIIPNIDYGDYTATKPDGLLVDRTGKDIKVIAVLENKDVNSFKTEKQRKSATEQCNTLCQVLGAKTGIATDNNEYVWINPLQPDPANEYKDHINGTVHSYTYILNEDKRPLTEPFAIGNNPSKDENLLDEVSKNTLYYLNRIISDLSSTNSILFPTNEIDPLPLARSVWQDIYVNTQRSPVKCLYNVVEIFIFKFLSDLGVLKNPFDFNSIMGFYSNLPSDEVLSYYAINCRPEINKLFPKGADGTNIINGTIFVNEKGEAVKSQATLFKNSLEKFKNFGSLRHIKKEFKTKLFETFLKQSKEKSKLGQFFTPRKIVKAMVDMSGVENLPQGSRVADPFCGVGGFLLESIQKPRRKGDFIPRNGKISPKIIFEGYDKGMDSDEERTIILAKANMLVYLSDIVEKYPNMTQEFERVFNETFHLLTDSNLGTLGMIKNADEKYDLILTNPPYITNGVTSLKKELTDKKLDKYYKKGKGVEALALQWIMNNLRENGRAFVVIPDSILIVDANIEIKKQILHQFNILCIISLPVKAFFNTPKKTYILGLEKRSSLISTQTDPVFTYIVSNVGETLDINRFEIEGKSDLESAKDLFNMFKGSPATFAANEIGDPRCKVQPIDRFDPKTSWDIEMWWPKKEKIDLGIEKKVSAVSVKEFVKEINNLSQKLKEYANELESLYD